MFKHWLSRRCRLWRPGTLNTTRRCLHYRSVLFLPHQYTETRVTSGTSTPYPATSILTNHYRPALQLRKKNQNETANVSTKSDHRTHMTVCSRTLVNYIIIYVLNVQHNGDTMRTQIKIVNKIDLLQTDCSVAAVLGACCWHRRLQILYVGFT